MVEKWSGNASHAHQSLQYWLCRDATYQKISLKILKSRSSSTKISRPGHQHYWTSWRGQKAVSGTRAIDSIDVATDDYGRTVGGKVQDFPDLETARKVGVDHTLAAANAFATSLAPRLESGRKFAFVFCSGDGASRDPDTKLWIMSDTRKIKVRQA